jgi:predicted TIM-barrel fold metal-dependent hydrolase
MTMIGLIDTHQHLVYPDAAGYSWTKGIPVLAKNAFTLADYQALTEGLGIEATLFMETAVDDPDIAAETKLVSDLAKSSDSGIVGLIATCRPEIDKGFDAWLNDAKAQGAVGLRRILYPARGRR